MWQPLEQNAPTDFDFIIGRWQVRHRRLKERLNQCEEWDEFVGYSSTQKVLGGFGNIEDNQLLFPEQTFRAIAIRSYDASSRNWLIWWLDGRFPGVMDVPVKGQFSDGVGTFYADDVFAGKQIKVRFLWSVPTPNRPRWEQAFSIDDGKTWETNWTMEFLPDNN